MYPKLEFSCMIHGSISLTQEWMILEDYSLEISRITTHIWANKKDLFQFKYGRFGLNLSP